MSILFVGFILYWMFVCSVAYLYLTLLQLQASIIQVMFNRIKSKS